MNAGNYLNRLFSKSHCFDNFFTFLASYLGFIHVYSIPCHAKTYGTINIQNIFESKRIDKISTADLITALCDDEEAPWLTYNRGKPIVPRQFKKQLEPYQIESKKIRIDLKEVRGFELSQFSDAFMRYLTPPNLSVYPSQIHKNPVTARPIGETDRETEDRYNIYPSQLQPSNSGICDSKTDKTAFPGIGSNAPIFATEVF